MSRITRIRGRKILVSIASTLLICAAVGFAYWALMAGGKGSSTPTTLGKAPAAGEIVIEPSFAANVLKPGAETPLKISITNGTASATRIKRMTTTFTVDTEHATAGCLASWFSITNGGTHWTELLGSGLAVPIAVPVKGSTEYTTELFSPSVGMKEEAAVDQKACLDAAEGGVGSESAKLTLALTSTPN